MRNIKSTAVIVRMREIFAIHDIAYFLVRSIGPSFFSQEFNNFGKLNGIKHLTISPHHPSSDGAAEQTDQTFKTPLNKLLEEDQYIDLDATLLQFLLSHRTTPHCSTNPPLLNYYLIGNLKLAWIS